MHEKLPYLHTDLKRYDDFSDVITTLQLHKIDRRVHPCLGPCLEASAPGRSNLIDRDQIARPTHSSHNRL
jgi:hypothetical protein